MPDDLKAYYEYQACLMEPWDGPAAMAFTDGTVIGGCLDRNGLRPCRYWVMKDGTVIMASEAGVLDVPQADVVSKGRLRPAACSWSIRHRAASSATAKSKKGWPKRILIANGSTSNKSSSTTSPKFRRERPLGRRPVDVAACIWLHPRGSENPDGSDGNDGYEAIGSMGKRYPVGGAQ